VPGHVAEYGPRLATRGEVIAVAAEFDPQPLHLDEDAARPRKLGGLSASGWGLMMSHNTGTNRNGELVLSFVSIAFVERRAKPERAP
jgi:acyl dehydratase